MNVAWVVTWGRWALIVRASSMAEAILAASTIAGPERLKDGDTMTATRAPEHDDWPTLRTQAVLVDTEAMAPERLSLAPYLRDREYPR